MLTTRPLTPTGRKILIVTATALLMYGFFCSTARAAEPVIVGGGSGFTGTVPLFGGVESADRATWLLRLDLHRQFCQESRVSAVFGIVPLELQTHTPGTVYGFGVDPLGISVRLGPAFVSGRGGVRWFTRAVPIPEGQRFNFTFDVEAGFRVKYRYTTIYTSLDLHHVSNGGLGERNPGINYLMLTVGVGR